MKLPGGAVLMSRTFLFTEEEVATLKKNPAIWLMLLASADRAEAMSAMLVAQGTAEICDMHHMHPKH